MPFIFLKLAGAILLILGIAVQVFASGSANSAWGYHLPGITLTLPVSENEKVLYLTLDACEGKADEALINLLIKHNVPATLFINARWIDRNPKIFMKIAENPLFEIENHGTKHLPASVSGRSIYGIKGTSSKEELIAEIMANQRKIKNLIGKEPKWYRSGAAYYDNEAVKIIKKELNLNIAGFAISLDAGATLPAQKVYEQSIKAKPGDILLAHMNRPESETTKGLSKAIPKLLANGFVFKVLP